MATTELSSGKTVVVLAVVVGCFGMLWPRVFYPMMQTAFMATRPRELTEGNLDNAVCCDIIHENDINFKFFAELCHSVLKPKEQGSSSLRRSGTPPPGTLERCQQKILKLCDIDIYQLIAKNKGVKTYRIESKVDDEKAKLNLSQCLEKHFQYGANKLRKQPKETILPSHIRQERPPRMGHPVAVERGQVFSAQKKVQSTYANQGGRTVSGIRPNVDAKPEVNAKGGGAMGFLMPIYTVGIIVFFLYTIAKVLLKKSQNGVSNDVKPKINTFHMDPEYHKHFTRNKQYFQDVPLSYQDYLNLKENSMVEGDESDECIATKLLSKGGKSQVFTAIEGIIAEMDDFREKVKVDQTVSQEEKRIENDDLCTWSNLAEDLQAVRQDLNQERPLSKMERPNNELAEHLKQIIQLDHAKIATLEREAQTQTPQPTDEISAQDAEVANIMLEKAVPSDTQLLVTESQCLTHTSVEHIDGWSECEDNPIIVTGKMTISLLDNEKMTVVNSNQTIQSDEHAPEAEQVTPTPMTNDDTEHLDNNNEEEEENNAVERTEENHVTHEMNGEAHIAS